jgi:capping protein alpha
LDPSIANLASSASPPSTRKQSHCTSTTRPRVLSNYTRPAECQQHQPSALS